MATRQVEITKGSKWEKFGPPGLIISVERTHLREIHPTKGYRTASRPAGTNRRRRPISGITIPGSTEGNKRAALFGNHGRATV